MFLISPRTLLEKCLLILNQFIVNIDTDQQDMVSYLKNKKPTTSKIDLASLRKIEKLAWASSAWSLSICQTNKESDASNYFAIFRRN